MACLENPDPVGMKVEAPSWEETFDAPAIYGRSTIAASSTSEPGCRLVREVHGFRPAGPESPPPPMSTYTLIQETIRGEASDVTTSDQRQTFRATRPWGLRGTRAGVWLAGLLVVLVVLVVGGCSDSDEKLPPRKALKRADKGAGGSGAQAAAAPDPQPLPADVPPRPVFAPAGMTDVAKRQTRLRDECFEVAETLLADFPADPAGWTLLGAVYRHFGDEAGAEKLLSKALAIAPDFPDAHRHLGDAALERGDLDGAEAHYRLALEADPEALVVIDSLVETLLAKGDTAAATEILRGFLDRHPRVVEGWCLLGKTGLVEGDFGAAREAFERRSRSSRPPAMRATAWRRRSDPSAGRRRCR